MSEKSGKGIKNRFNKEALSEKIKSRGKDAASKTAPGKIVDGIKTAGRFAKKLIQAAINAAKALVSFIVNLFTNPLFYVPVIVFIVIAVVLTSATLFGPNFIEYDCGKLNAPEFTVLTDRDVRVKLMMGHFMNQGWDRHTSAVWSLALDARSDGNPQRGSNCDSNECLDQSTGPVGLGLFSGDIRKELVEFAKGKNLIWSSSSVQLRFLTNYIEEREDEFISNGMTASGFDKLIGNDGDISINSTEIEELIEEYKEEGSQCQAIGDGCSESSWDSSGRRKARCRKAGLNADNLAAFGWSFAREEIDGYLADTPSSSCPIDEENVMQGHHVVEVDGGCTKSRTTKEEYVEAMRLAVENSYPSNFFGYASCDQVVGVAIVGSEYDTNFVARGCGNINRYLQESPKWMRVDCSDRQPGDIVLFLNDDGITWGHVILYVGNVDGCESGECFIEGSYGEYEAKQRDSVVGDPCTYGTGYQGRTQYWWRCVGCNQRWCMSKSKENNYDQAEKRKKTIILIVGVALLFLMGIYTLVGRADPSRSKITDCKTGDCLQGETLRNALTKELEENTTFWSKDSVLDIETMDKKKGKKLYQDWLSDKNTLIVSNHFSDAIFMNWQPTSVSYSKVHEKELGEIYIVCDISFDIRSIVSSPGDEFGSGHKELIDNIEKKITGVIANFSYNEETSIWEFVDSEMLGPLSKTWNGVSRSPIKDPTRSD